MGTRSLTVMLDEEGKEIAVLYRQMDGYPEGHGEDLKEFLDGFKVVNGYNGSEGAKATNGMGCLAAQIIAHFKEGIGNFYLYPAGTRGCGEEWIYTVLPGCAGEPLRLRVEEAGFEGSGEDKADARPAILMYEGPVRGFDPEAVQEAFAAKYDDSVKVEVTA